MAPKKAAATAAPEYDSVVIIQKSARMRAVYGVTKGQDDTFICSFMTDAAEAFVVPALESHYGITLKERANKVAKPAAKATPKKAPAKAAPTAKRKPAARAK